MHEVLQTPHFSFNKKRIAAGRFGEHITRGNVFSRRAAGPLLNADLRQAAITERSQYDSGAPGGQVRRYHTFTLLLQGEMEIWLNERRKTIGPGELVCAPAGTRFRRTGKGATWWLYFELFDTDRWAPLKAFGPYIKDYEHATLMFLHLRIVMDARNKASSEVPSLALDSARFLVRLLMHEMTTMGRKLSPHTRELEQLMDEIVRRPQEAWTVAEMARRTAISRSHLSALFREQYGLPPLEAVIKQRMLKAIELLVRENQSVQATASAVGYQSVCSFTRLFTKHVGLSPRQYRQAHR